MLVPTGSAIHAIQLTGSRGLDENLSVVLPALRDGGRHLVDGGRDAPDTASVRFGVGAVQILRVIPIARSFYAFPG